jgi:hypothetical protein
VPPSEPMSNLSLHIASQSSATVCRRVLCIVKHSVSRFHCGGQLKASCLLGSSVGLSCMTLGVICRFAHLVRSPTSCRNRNWVFCGRLFREVHNS